MDKDANNTSDLFTVTPSKNEESHVVEFHSKEVFDEMADKFTELYGFKDNARNPTAITASTLVEGKKVFLTLYKSQKLMIKGAGSKDWKSTTFKLISEELKSMPETDRRNNKQRK